MRDTTITFVGDVHGKTERFLREVPTEGAVFQIGDMGLGFGGVRLPHLREDMRFIRGNHDDPALCKLHSNYAGEFGYDDRYKLFFMGGAYSIDVLWRVSRMAAYGGPAIWWPDEQLSPEQLEEATALYKKMKPSIVATHEAPSSIVPLTLPTGFRSEKLECIHTRTAAALEQMFQFHQPKLWVYGHYHIDRDFVEKGTRFVCLNELSQLEVAVESTEQPVPTAPPA